MTIKIERPDADAVCKACRHKGAHGPGCPFLGQPWPTLEVDVTAEFEAIATQAKNRLEALLGQPVFLFAAYSDIIDEDGDRAAGCWSPETDAEPREAAFAAFIIRQRAEELFTSATGLPWDEQAHQTALAIAGAVTHKENP